MRLMLLVVAVPWLLPLAQVLLLQIMLEPMPSLQRQLPVVLQSLSMIILVLQQQQILIYFFGCVLNLGDLVIENDQLAPDDYFLQ